MALGIICKKSNDDRAIVPISPLGYEDFYNQCFKMWIKKLSWSIHARHVFKGSHQQQAVLLQQDNFTSCCDHNNVYITYCIIIMQKARVNMAAENECDL